jgi:NAD(P)-dependent dehydrogenase (short-subunit alcohol dehydrogenase family)
MPRLAGKVALITGGGAGIGHAAALLFAREGAKVAIAEINPERGERTAAEVKAAGGSALFMATDITVEEAVRRIVERTVADFGKLDILYNCAGGAVVEDDYVTDVDMKVWERTIGLDLKGTFLCCRHAVPAIIAAGGGAVVNMSSGAALRGASPAHVYTAAKGAILSLTRALAGRYARDGVRVNAICSGRVLTERITGTYGTLDTPGPLVDRQDPVGRAKEYPFWVGEPEDMANIALFLASDESRMITGATIAADGGRSAY